MEKGNLSGTNRERMHTTDRVDHVPTTRNSSICKHILQFLDSRRKETFATPNVATGWAEYLEQLRRLASEGTRDHLAGWATFEKLAAGSPQPEPLMLLVRLGRDLPERERYRLAVAVTRLLAPMEWPLEWEVVRPGLIYALSELADEMDPDGHDSFFGHVVTKEGAKTRRIAHLTIVAAIDLLRKPRRDQLRSIAMLCNASMAACIEAYRQFSKSVPLANTQVFGLAIAEYASAADLLNDATGAVLFEGLHAVLEED